MPGRPRTMAKRVTRLEHAAHELRDNVYATCPAQYRVEPNDDNVIANLWYDAICGAYHTAARLHELAEILRDKAGISAPTIVPEKKPQGESPSTNPPGPVEPDIAVGYSDDEPRF